MGSSVSIVGTTSVAWYLRHSSCTVSRKAASVHRGTEMAWSAAKRVGAVEAQSMVRTADERPRDAMDSRKQVSRPTRRPADERRMLLLSMLYSEELGIGGVSLPADSIPP